MSQRAASGRFVLAALGLATLAGIGALAAGPAAAEPSHALAMHGDLKYGPDFKHFDYVNPDAPIGGSVTLGAIGGFDSFNPFIVKGEPAAGIGQVYDTLMTSSLDEPFSEYGQLAETVETPDDRSWVEFTLRPEARWHDGEPITVEDVIWTFNTLVENGQPFYRFYYGNVSKVEKTGDRSVRFSFKEGVNRELPLILGQLTVLPKHWWESREFDATSLEPPLGSGPYRVKDFEAGRYVTYERVEDYWGADLSVNKGHNNYDTIRYDYYRDSNIAIEAFKGGEFDFRMENSSKHWATAYDSPELDEGLIVKAEVHHERPSGMQGFAYNIRRELFKDPRVRRALAYAFDFEWSNKTLFYGQYSHTRSYFENSEMAATGLPSEAELELLEPLRDQLPPEVFTTEYNPPTSDGSGNIRGNLREAVTILRETGWGIKDGKLTHTETGRVMAFELLLVSPLFERIALPFAKNLERIGIDMSVRIVDQSQYIERLNSFDFDMIVSSWGQSLSPGNEQRDFWGSEAADRQGSRNVVGIKDPAIDSLIETLIAAPTREALVTACRALDRVLQWHHFVIPQFHAPYDRLVYWNRFGRPETVPMQGTSFSTWWVDPDKAARIRAERGK